MATATGPTPPGTGLMTEAFSAHAGSASPTTLPLDSEAPASIIATPSLMCSAFINPGLPAPQTTMSASLRSSTEPSLRVNIETRAPRRLSRTALGAPTRRPAPTTTAFFPFISTPARFRSSMTASATGAKTGCLSSGMEGLSASTSFSGGMAPRIAFVSSVFGSGNWTMTESVSCANRFTTSIAAARVLMRTNDSMTGEGAATTIPSLIPRSKRARRFVSASYMSSAIALPSIIMSCLCYVHLFLKHHNTIFQTPPRFPAEQLPRLPVVGERIMRLKPRLNMHGRAAYHCREIVHRKIPARAYVQHLSFPYLGRFRREQISTYDIRNMREIAGLRSIARYGKRGVFLFLFEELSDDQCVGPVRIKLRSVYIEIAQAHGGEAVDFSPEPARELTDILLQSVRAFGLCR